ncbi:ABC transporter, transmembrane domain, type 1 [Akanthomyces lecanii RCEF 1005]|uniref:ABC transporter, transmembrane domain, type 1 n=1 Tax=Akanthomyces lecanii RCEF 1005 TaxID=1081108 RepID=A0A162LIG8_CORDF|nr:ABC transporter, transmembrane domain, type 1 [Akanthomyces lecanii RCEF 1005]
MATARDDQSLWPPLKAIYDLTLTFENTVLGILPDGILLLLSPVVLLHYLNKPVHVRQSPLLWIKLIVSVALVGTNIASLIFRAVSGNYRTETALPAASLELLAVITISIAVYVEHRHAIRGSALLGVYLFFGVIADIIKSRSFFLRPGLTPMGALAVASGVLRIILLGLQEVPKTQLLLDRQLQSTIGREATSGYWNRSFFVHLYPLLLSGFRGVLVLSDLSNLGPDFAAELLYTQLKQYWKQARKVSRNALFVSCICTWKILFAAIILPRLAQSGFSLAQPFILYRAITVVGDDNVGNFERVLLLLGTILSFGGATMSKTTTSHLHNRLVTRIRGALVAQMFDKSLRVSQSETKKSAAITLMSADIEGIADGLPKLYELIMTLVDLGLGIFVLSLFVGRSCFVVLAPLAVSAIATYFLGNWIGAAFVSWNKSIETRVSKTSKVIDQLKAIKMFGLNPIVSDYLHNFRELEMASSNKFRGLEAVAVVSVLCAEYLTPVVVIAAALFWNTFGGKMSAATVFPSLSMIVLIKDPLSLLLDGYPVLKAMFGCFRRIQEFLNLEERKDPRILRESPSPTAESQLLGYESPPLPIVEFSRAKIAPIGTQIPILNDIDFVLMPGSMTGVVGANGSGKSLLLQGILGEAELMDGNIYIGETDIALCGQTVWLRNGSLRDNIIGPLPYDEVLFRKVLRCCLLDQDIEQLPGGADYVVGSGGSRLSGGQRQRVGLARTLYARKALVLLDDVFSSLDRRTAISILFRLCGEDGILRELNCAVVFCTYLPECQDVADQLIVLDGNGHATVDIKSNREARMEMIRSLDSGKAIVTEEDEAQEQEKIRLSFEQQPEPAAGPADPAKETPPKADKGLYWLFIKPMGGFNVLLWSFTMLLASVGEMAPDVYMRLWIERDPENDLYFIGYAAIAFLAVIIFVVGAAWMFVRLMPRASIALHQQLVDTVLRGTIGFLGTIDNGVIINRFSQDMTLMARALVLNFLRTISVFFTALIQAGIIASGSSYMAIILPVIAVAVFFIQLFYLRTSRQIRIFDLERKSPLYTHFQESSEGLIHIRAFGWQKQNLEHAFKLLDDSQKAFYYMYCVQLWLGLVLGLLSTLIAAILMASALFATKSTSETALGLSFLNLILFAKTMEQLLKTWTRLELAVGALARLRDFMSTTPQESEQGRIPVPGNWPSMGNIELSGVTARYSDDEQRPATLKNISLSIDAGQKVGIVGRTGSGKSSLFLLLLGFLRYEGTMKVDGISISSIPVDELRSRIVTISQDQLKLEASARVNLLPFTLNLSPTVTDEKKRQEAERQDIRLRELLIRLGIWTPLNNKGGLDAMLDDVGYSHGQMQLFCLARGILRCQDTGSKVVLVDEATSSVEEEMERNAQRVMKEYFADCTVLVIGHRKSSIRGVEFTVELSKGEVVHVDPNALDSDEGDFR